MKNPSSKSVRRLTVLAAIFALSMMLIPAAFTRSKQNNKLVNRSGLTINTLFDSAQNRYSFKVTNNSKWEIHKLYVHSMEKDGWGRDLLGEYILKPGFEYTIPDLTPGEYGVKFVDEDGDECALENIKIFSNKSWSLTTAWLEKCEGYR